MPADKDTRTIKVGVMCLGRRFPAWQAEALRKVIELDNVEIELLIVQERSSLPVAGPISRLLGEPGHLIWNLYNKGLVQRRSRASRPVDMEGELAGVAEISCRVEPVGKYGERLTEADIAEVRSHDLDLILRFGFGILKGEILNSARFGVWSFHHGDERIYRGQPPAFWEVFEGEPVVGAILQRITERLDGGTVLHRGTFRVTAHSYRRTRDEVFMGAAEFPSIVIRQILDGDTSQAEAGPSKTKAPLRRSPGNGTMARFFARQAFAFLRSQWRGLTRASKWSVGVATVPPWRLLEDDEPHFEWAPEQGADRYLADPFPDPTGATSLVLVEDYDHISHRGVISAVDMAGDRLARPVLDAGVHASYPYLFEHHGDIYCVPETYQAGEVRFYRALEFPDRWDLAATALEGTRPLDPTVFRHGDKWWLFCTMEGEHSNTKLYAFHADEIGGSWKAHVLNPIKTDVTSSRPAGTPFTHRGHLYRPAQDSSTSYGGAVAINRIDELTPTRFAETTVKRVGPLKSGPYRAGLHTVSGRDDITIVDGRRDTFLMSAFRRELTGRLRRLIKRR